MIAPDEDDPRIRWEALTGGRQHVYFARCHRTGHIKIGTSHRVYDRLRRVSQEAQSRHKLIGAHVGGRALEAALHRRFRRFRLYGEWFQDVPEIRDYIAAYCTPYPAMTPAECEEVERIWAELEATVPGWKR